VKPFNGGDNVLTIFLKDDGDIYNDKKSSLKGRNA
jgi:hypothetical protein